MRKKKKVRAKKEIVREHTRQTTFIFNSSSKTKRTSQIYRRGEQPKITAAPSVYYTEQAHRVIQMLVQKCTQEVGWLGLVETIGSDYLITDIYVPEQTVSAAETDIDSEAMMDLYNELIADGKDTNKLFYWGHSHVNMGVGPSLQDENQVDEYLESMPLFIRGIYNKHGESKVDVYDVEKGLVYECVDNEVLRDGDDELEAAVDALIKKNVKTRVYKNNWPLVTPPRQKPVHGYTAQQANLLEAQFGLDDYYEEFEQEWFSQFGQKPI